MTANKPAATVEDLLANPHAFGFPNYAEYCKAPEKYKYTIGERLGHIDKSVHNFRNLVQKQRYRLGAFLVDKLEELERIAKNEGIDLMQCKLAPVVIRHAGGKVDIEVEFVPRTGLLDAKGTPVMKFFKRIFKREVSNEKASIT
jgi:hypothetical protein